MISLLSITLKILYTLVLTFLILFISNKDESNLTINKELLLFSLSSVSILSILSHFSILESNNFYSIGILSIFMITMIQVYLNNNKFKLYIIINYLIIAISLGYIVLSLIVALLYIVIDKYYIYILEYLHFESYNDDDDGLN
tara:strand:+ start:311 stop:736 length:426 start_codon:yes stop_codon:yes gene_type:complete